MNLTYPKKQILYSSIGPSQLATYTDKDGKKKLILKDNGTELLGGANASWSKTESDAATRRAILVTQTKAALSATPTNADYGIRVVDRLKTPGYVNNSELRGRGKYYGSAFNVSTYDEAKAIEINKEITRLIAADTGKNIDGAIPAGAVVRARVAYTVVDSDATDASGFTITWPDGTTTVFATATTFTGGNQIGTQLMGSATSAYGSTVGALLEVFQVGALTYVITSRQPGLEFTLDTPVDTTISTQGLLIDSKYDDILFDLQIDSKEFTQTGLNLVKLSCTGFGSPLNAHVAVDGTVSEITATTNQATQLAALNAVTGIYAINDSTNGFTIASALTVKTMKVNFPILNKAGNDPLAVSLATVSYEATKAGAFSSLTYQEVQQKFAAADHAGILREVIPGNFPVQATNYCVYTVNAITPVGGLHAAGSMESRKTTVELYIPASAARGNKWCDADKATGKDVASTTTDRTLEEVLAYWAS